MENFNARTERPTSAVAQQLGPTADGLGPMPLEENKRRNWRETFRQALRQARHERRPTVNRHELSRDHSKSMFFLLAASVGSLLIFFSVFSSPRKALVPRDATRGPNLGRKPTPGQQETNKRLAPILNADVQTSDGTSNPVTPEDIGRTSRLGDDEPREAGIDKAPAMKSSNREDYALKSVDFSDPAAGPSAPSIVNAPPAHPDREPAADLKKPSIVFVGAKSITPPLQQLTPQRNETRVMALLPAGTRLIARLQAAVSSAVPTPVLAVVEYNYERNGEIVLPAGARVLGRLTDVNGSGLVGIHFYRVEMPDGSSQSIDASAMDLKFSPLKGYVSGQKRGTRFLVRSLAGVGTMAAYMVGGHGTTGFDGPISENALLRERLADNIAMAGQDQLNTLSVSRNIVVTLPGNTRFYIVIDRSGSDYGDTSRMGRTGTARASAAAESHIPNLEELRELMQLRRELNQMYVETNTQTSVRDGSADLPR